MNSNNTVAVMFFVGIFVGAMIATGICTFKLEKYAEKVIAGKTISAGNYFAQYSAVRRFPK